MELYDAMTVLVAREPACQHVPTCARPAGVSYVTNGVTQSELAAPMGSEVMPRNCLCGQRPSGSLYMQADGLERPLAVPLAASEAALPVALPR